ALLDGELEELVDVEGLGLVALALDLHRPGPRLQLARVPRGIVLVGAKLVEVVVVGDFLERVLLLVGGRLARFDSVELAPVRHIGRSRAGASRKEHRPGARGAEREKLTAPQIDRLRRDFGRTDAHGISQRPLIDVDRARSLQRLLRTASGYELSAAGSALRTIGGTGAITGVSRGISDGGTGAPRCRAFQRSRASFCSSGEICAR